MDPSVESGLTGLAPVAWLIYPVLAVICAEAVALAWYGARERRLTPRLALTVVMALLPGVCILMALSAALRASGEITIAAWLAAAFPAHLLDLKLRPVAQPEMRRK